MKEKVINVYEAARRGETCAEVVFVFAFETVGAVKDILIVSHNSKHAPEVLLKTLK